MRNILNLLYKYNFVLLFIALQGVAFSLLFHFNQYQHTSLFNSSNAVAGWILNIRNSVVEPFNAQEANKRLKKENAALHEQLPESYKKMDNGLVVINDTIYEQQYHYIPCKAINNSTNKRNNYITLNAGSDQGVEKGMGVIGPNGIVGFVKEASSRYALVISTLNGNFSTPVMIQKTKNYGYLEWDGRNPEIAQIEGVASSASIQKGDTVITKGSTARFPEGILVGNIKDFDIEAGDKAYQINLKLSTDFNQLYQVYVVKNKFRQEQLNLEEKSAE